MRHIVEVHKFRQVSIFDAVVVVLTNVLMLMVEIFAEFGEPHGGEALLIESVVVASAQEAVQPEDQKRLDPGMVRASDVGDVAGKFARSRVTLSAEHSNSLDFSLARRRRQPFGKHAHHARILFRTEVASYNVVVQNSFELPCLLLGHLGEVLAAVQALLFSRDRQKNDSGWELCREFGGARSLAQNAGTLQAHRRAAAIVVRSRRRVGPVKSIAVARVVMAGHQHDAIRLLRVGSAQHRINIGDFRRFWDTLARLLGESVSFHLQTATAVFRIALKLRFDPLPRRADSLARFDGFLVLRGNRGPVLEADQLLDRLPDVVR